MYHFILFCTLPIKLNSSKTETEAVANVFLLHPLLDIPSHLSHRSSVWGGGGGDWWQHNLLPLHTSVAKKKKETYARPSVLFFLFFFCHQMSWLGLSCMINDKVNPLSGCSILGYQYSYTGVMKFPLTSKLEKLLSKIGHRTVSNHHVDPAPLANWPSIAINEVPWHIIIIILLRKLRFLAILLTTDEAENCWRW